MATKDKAPLGPPGQEKLENAKADLREVFVDLRTWVKAEQKQRGSLESHGQTLSLQHRRSIFDFLSSLPDRKPVFGPQAKELIRTLANVPEWREGDAVDEATVLEASKPSEPRAGKRGSVLSKDAKPEPTILAEPAGPTPAPSPPPGPALAALPEAEQEAEEPDVLDGFPKAEAFAEKARQDAGDTFKELRKWARRRAVWDLAAAGSRLDAGVRRDVFGFLSRICERKIYSSQGREILNMLLSVDEWVADDVVDEASVCKVLDAAPAKPPALPDKRRASTSPRRRSVESTLPEPAPRHPTQAPAPAPSPAPLAVLEPAPPAARQGPRPEPVKQLPAYPPDQRPPRAQPEAKKGPREPIAGLPVTEGAKAQKASETKPKPLERLQGRVEAALRAGAAESGGMGAKDLVSLYQNAGLGGQASFSAEATDKVALRILLGVAGQRLRDLYIDDLHRVGARSRVHLPHLYIDLKRREAHTMPEKIKESVEVKIRSMARWTCIEKSYVLSAKHELTIRYVLAYALSQGKATGRPGAIWIPVGMDSGATGHANAVCLQTDGVGSVARAWVYDPNFSPNQEHWVHAQKAVNDALPGVKTLLSGTGVAVPQRAELFGHGLQTALGTVEKHKGWFSSKVTITTRGYPICGAVVHLLGMVWLEVSSGGSLDSLADVESCIAEVAGQGDEGKLMVQQCIAALLRRISAGLDSKGAEGFSKSLQRRLDEDRKEWPAEIVHGGGSITMTGAKGRSLKYSW